MLMPTAPGVARCINDLAEVDYTNRNDGYITARYTGPLDAKCIAQVMCGNFSQKFKIIDSLPKTIPLCYGNGDYTVLIVAKPDDQGAALIRAMACKFTVVSCGPLSPYLYPNVYCDYTESSLCVQAANKACVALDTDTARFNAIYRWVVDNIEYDRELARRLTTGEESSWWIPDPDSVVVSGLGICWGYASLIAAMCRSQGIPCKICVGRAAGAGLHAWNEVYLTHAGKVGKLKVDPNEWMHIDVTFLDSGKESDSIISYAGDKSNYSTEYYG